MGWLVALLAVAACFAWLVTAGWLVALELRARRRRSDPLSDPDPWPALAVVLPVRDEARWIDDRLRDFAAFDYPADRLELWVVDGGSRDATPERVEAAAARDPRVRLLRIEDSRSKLEQVRLALEKLRTPVAVVIDADVALAPDGLRALVRTLEADPCAGLVGASLEPDTPLLEERLHWWLVDRLSWLEGELLGAATVAAPCYALRPEAVRTALPDDVTADDVHLGLVARARGWRVRRAAAARARELRVPRTWLELVRFRARRGGGFLREVRAFLERGDVGPGLRASLWLRWAQLRAAPWLAAGLVVAAPWAGAAGLAIVGALVLGSLLPLLVAARCAPAFAADRRPPWRLPWAAARLLAAHVVSLVAAGWHAAARRAGP